MSALPSEWIELPHQTHVLQFSPAFWIVATVVAEAAGLESTKNYIGAVLIETIARRARRRCDTAQTPIEWHSDDQRATASLHFRYDTLHTIGLIWHKSVKETRHIIQQSLQAAVSRGYAKHRHEVKRH